MKQKLMKSPYELMHEISKLEALVKKYEAAAMPKLAARYRRQLAAAQRERLGFAEGDGPIENDAPPADTRISDPCADGWVS